MSDKKIDRGWAIKHSSLGFYTGWRLTRNDAIADHVADIYGGERFPMGRGDALSDIQRSHWKQCRTRGDRATKIELRERR